ncbi:MAG: XylR family transcriptional regulator [Planctomycetia bacterium]|nr:XylR family transcriptional regulator [Planctomycetia bacterium]
MSAPTTATRKYKVALLIETSREYARGLLRGIALWNQKHGAFACEFQPYGLSELPTNWLKNWNGDGVLVRIDNKEMEEVVLASGLPAIDLRSSQPNPRVLVMGVDNVAIAHMAFEHLHDAGFVHYAFCGTRRHINVYDDQRREYFRELVEEAGLTCDDFPAERVSQRGKVRDNELHAIAKWLKTLPIPTAVMACKDDRGIQVLEAARLIGRKIPDELAILSVDNDPFFCNLADPSLTSIDTNSDHIGYEAAAQLYRMMQGETCHHRTILFPPREVVKRRSTDVLAISNRKEAEILGYLREMALAGLTVRDVAEHFDISISHLERLSKKYFNRTPKEEMFRVQIEEAKKLLKRTRLSLNHVAVQSGFRSVSYFMTTFKRVTGYSAMGWRGE